MSEIHGVKLTEAQLRRRVPKYGMNLDDVNFSIGSEELVRRMRQADWLKPAHEKPLLFDAGDVALAWQRIANGDRP